MCVCVFQIFEGGREVCPIEAPPRSAPMCVAVRAVEVLRRNNGGERRFTARLNLQSRERIESKKRVRLEY